MNKTSGGTMLVAGIFLIILGIITQTLLTDLVAFLVKVLGLVMVAGGIAVGIFGLIKMLSSNKNSTGNF